MAIFKKKEPGYVDLSEKLRKREERLNSFKESTSESQTEQAQETASSNSGGFFNFFSAQSKEEPIENNYDSPEEKRKRLIKRVIELTKKSESQEKEIDELKKRLDTLERKQRLSY